LASMAAPPSRAPIAMAPVWAGAKLLVWDVEVVVVVVEVEEVSEPKALVSEESWDEMDDLSLPVAVLRTDESELMELASTEDEADETSELSDDETELTSDEAADEALDATDDTASDVVVEVMVEVVVPVVELSVLVEVTVEVPVCVVWAATREARARTATATRILAVVLFEVYHGRE